jgi:hypothetical protein
MGRGRRASTGGEAMPPSRPPPTRVRWDDRPWLPPHAAGLARGARALVVAGPPARDAAPGRGLAPFTPARHALVAGRIPGGLDTAALEWTVNA